MDDDIFEIEDDEPDLGELTNFYKTTFGDQEWRLENLYPFQADSGEVRIFKMRDLQRKMYRDRHARNVILKARQLGSSTFWAIFILDSILFSQNPLRCGIIAQTVAAAEKIMAKCAFAFKKMDEDLLEGLGITAKITAKMITFSNGATLEAGITFRSGQCDILLVSELGKMAAKMPQKATEVVTGSFPTVHRGGMIIVESTAEGKDGYLFDLVANAQEIERNPNKMLGSDDFLLHFFAWHEKDEYKSQDPYDLTEEDKMYFDRMRLRGYLFSKEQQWWWARQHSNLKEEIYREFPTFVDEAFMATGRALILATAMIAAEEKGQVGSLPFNPDLPCVTAWDIGATSAVWIFQFMSPTTLAFIDYLEGQHANFDLWKTTLDARAKKKGYTYGAHVLPWDGDSKVAMTASAKYWAEEAGFENVYCNPRQPFDMQVRVAHMMMPSCFFDADGTMLGRQRLLSYRRVYNQASHGFEERPDKGLPSHGSEAFINALFFDPSEMTMVPKEGHKGSGPSNPPAGKRQSRKDKKAGFIGRLLGDTEKKPTKRGEAVLRDADGVHVLGKGFLRRLMS